MHRRIAAALRRFDEISADRPDTDGESPRARVAGLIATTELAAAVLGALAAGGAPPTTRTDGHPATVAALMYAAPTLSALLARMGQGRRLLASLARSLESRFDEQHPTPWGQSSPRGVLTATVLLETARCAQALERTASQPPA